MTVYDVIVVGAGPAGSVAARTAAQEGAHVLLLEEHLQVGHPVRCTGLLSVRGVEQAGVSRDVLLRPIRGAFIYGPEGERLTVGGPAPKGYVMDRGRFDQDLVEQASHAGVQVVIGARACALTRSTASSELVFRRDGREERVRGRVIIGADGPQSRVAHWAGLPRPRRMIAALQVTIAHEPERPDFVEVFVGRQIAPDFFAWAVPAGPGEARVGLGTSQGPQIRALLDKLLERWGAPRRLSEESGVIPLGLPERTVTDGIMLVGDAAGQAKPTSGGGIYTGTSCARIAGEVAARAALSGRSDRRTLWEYERRWRALLERELRFGFQAHQALRRLGDGDLSRLFRAADHPQLLALLGEHGDIDYTSRALRAMLRRPRLWGRVLRAIPFDLQALLELLGGAPEDIAQYAKGESQ
ncbi:MAG TPA: NAD(P)/FAD-dependent oxidoreductase [Candidatus Fraserbacteria bacterium]|nr:NAD(P)/FAD-dependent oxidoreductase [Candidatus Fraserbacteria bacterium]